MPARSVKSRLKVIEIVQDEKETYLQTIGDDEAKVEDIEDVLEVTAIPIVEAIEETV